MAEFWEHAFTEMQAMWGWSPTLSAEHTAEQFAAAGVTTVLLPGAGYGRNAIPFLDRGMAVTGIEVSATAVALARAHLGDRLHLHHGSVADMPFDDARYDGVFCHGLLYLLDAPARTTFLRRCAGQLAPGGAMVFTLVSKRAPMYGQGPKLGDDTYERHPGLPMFFYDEASVAREFGPLGRVACVEVDEPAHGTSTLPFLRVTCHPSP